MRAALACAAALLGLAAAAIGCAQTVRPAPGAGAAPCAPAATLAVPDGIQPMRLKLLDEGEHFKVYTAVEGSVGDRVDANPAGLNRLFADAILRTRRFNVFDMRAGVTADHSAVRITAKVVDAGQLLRPEPLLEKGTRVSESWVKLAVQVKNMDTGENLLDSELLVENRTGDANGRRAVVMAHEDVQSPELRKRLSEDLSKALFGAFAAAGTGLEQRLRPLARVISTDIGPGRCQLDLFGGGRIGLQAKDELVVFRAEREPGSESGPVRTRAVALVSCASVGSDSAQCTVLSSVAGFEPREGDFAAVTDASLKRTRVK